MSYPRLDFKPNLDALGCDWHPIKLDGLIRLWLQSHFADPNNLTLPQLSKLVYTTADDSPIMIETIGAWKPTMTEKRPGLIVKRHKVTPLQLGIAANNLMNGSTNNFHSVLLQGAHSVYCISGASGEADLLAAEVYRELMKFAPVVRKRFNMARVALAGVDESAKLEEAYEHFVVPVTIAYGFWDTWKLTVEDAGKLQNIIAQLAI